LTACKKRKLVWERGVGPKTAPAMHVYFTAEKQFVGLARPGNNSPWPMGIPRLRFPAEAPSRSTLKLEEAFLTLLTEHERDTLLNSRKTAVDLGAAPGGWTWQLINREIPTTCIDNADLAEVVAKHRLVTHLRENALTWTPRRKVDWMVCDVVEKPQLITELVTRWIIQGHTRRVIFNLKLPMKKRYQEVTKLLAELQKACAKKGAPVSVRCRQLFHDREEVTVYLFPEIEGIE
jgi:23S rRNA (cytidine2498-2'-O)-methyltransferase